MNNLKKKKLLSLIKQYKSQLKQNIIIGGVGDETDPNSLNQNQLQVGILVQMQHTNNKNIAKQIAIDHLTQHPNYYTKLIKAGLVDQEDAIQLAKQNGVL